MVIMLKRHSLPDGRMVVAQLEGFEPVDDALEHIMPAVPPGGLQGMRLVTAKNFEIVRIEDDQNYYIVQKRRKKP